MKIAIVGATGLVGQMMLKILDERDFPISDLILVASEKSIGNKIDFRDKKLEVVSIETALSEKPQIAFFAAGGNISKMWAPKFAEKGITVIDNSSAWRMEPNIKLVVPEINGNVLTKEDKIISNPNCSTIQLVMALAPLHQKYKLKRVVVSTYQSVSGTGTKAIKQMANEMAGIKGEMAYPYQIFKNALPHCDVFEDNEYTKEEMKLIQEPKKILNDDSFSVTATAVRVPVEGGHSESVNVELHEDFTLGDIRLLLHHTPGIKLQDNPDTNTYPMPVYAQGKDEVFVGRVRRDESQENTLNMWIVSDNLRKGAATNAVQIAEYLVKNQLL